MKNLVQNQGLMGYPNPYELQESCEFTFLKVFTNTKTKWLSKKFFTNRFQN